MSIDDRDWRRAELKQQRKDARLLSTVSVKKPFNFGILFLYVFTLSAGFLLGRFLL